MHLLIGIIGFFAYTCPFSLFLQIPADTLLTGFFAALLGSVMPDVIEPARTWSHRGFGHSRKAMRFSWWGFALTAILGLFQVSLPGLSLSFIVSCFFLGYTLHLLADSVTKAGLPG